VEQGGVDLLAQGAAVVAGLVEGHLDHHDGEEFLLIEAAC
jgi:hypothetical protein